MADIKVLMINGQNHKGSTYHVRRMLAEKITKPEEIKEIFLPKDMPHFCCGCTQCFMVSEEKCPHYQEMHWITQLVDEADVLIFTSPVYVYHATGSMKALLDHYAYRFIVHRPEEKMFRKQAVVLSTAAGAAVRAISWETVKDKKKRVLEKKTDQLAVRIKKKNGRIKPGIKTKAFFYIMRIVHKKEMNPADTVYWREKGWISGKKPWK